MPTSYLLKITLRDMPQPIWRRFVVPSDIRLDKLHDVIQTVMGWDNCHLHSFAAGRQDYYPAEMVEDDCFGSMLPEEEYTLADLAPEKGAKIRYTYDFGDCWDHQIVVENCDYSNPDWPYAICCVKGVRACPPEDCGGVGGYENFCEVMANPKHREYREMKEWYGGKFDPEEFDLVGVNEALGVKMANPKKPTVKKTVKKSMK